MFLTSHAKPYPILFRRILAKYGHNLILVRIHFLMSLYILAYLCLWNNFFEQCIDPLDIA